jgi:hypothetical protein
MKIQTEVLCKSSVLLFWYDMKMKKKHSHERNWVLVIVSTVVIVLNLGVLVAVGLNPLVFGWWAILIVLGALSSIGLATLAIRQNDPSWLLLDLVLPT